MWEEEREERSRGHIVVEHAGKEAIATKKDAHKEMRKSGSEANKARYKNMKNRTKKVVAKAMKEAAERAE